MREKAVFLADGAVKSSRLERLFVRLGGRRGLFVAVTLAVLLTAPSLWVGFVLDDHLLQVLHLGPGPFEQFERGKLDTFAFSYGDPEEVAQRRDKGVVPWWTPDTWKVAFWRPVASLSHWADFALFGNRAWPMHVHSIAIYATLCGCVWLLYRRLLQPPWVAALAALLFAVDSSHGVPAGWISNRNALYSVLFGVLTLLAHHRYRAEGWRPGLALALGYLTLGLLSGEAAVCAGGYLFAYCVFMDRAPFARAFLALLPYLAVVVAWRVVYSSLGYGVSGSMLYTDPTGEPHIFLRNLAEFPPILLGSLFSIIDANYYSFTSGVGRAAFFGLSLAYIVFIVWAIWPLLRRDATARFWALGAVLSILPGCATLPQDRLLLFPSVGGLALVAQFLHAHSAFPATRRRGAQALAFLWITMHLILSPFLIAVNAYSVRFLEEFLRYANAAIPADEKLDDQTLVTVNTPNDYLSSGIFPAARWIQNQPAPEYSRVLCSGITPVEVRRTNERTLVLRPGGGFIPRPWAQLFRNPEVFPARVGETVELPGLRVEITEVLPDGRPAEAIFTFDRPLEDPSLRWITWERGGYTRFVPPPPGETVTVPGASPRELLLPLKERLQSFTARARERRS